MASVAGRLHNGYYHGMFALNPGWMMPAKLHNQITNRTSQVRDALFLVEHWDDPEQRVVEFVIYLDGRMSLDRVDDWWDDTVTFIPLNWEPT